MKFELDLIGDMASPLPLRDDGTVQWGDTALARASLRVITDKLIFDGLQKDSLLDTATPLAMTALCAATLAKTFRQEPEVEDFVAAAKALIEISRAAADKGLMLHSPEHTKSGLVMVELTLRGICAALSIPYDELLTAVHTGGDVRALLPNTKPETPDANPTAE